VADDRRVIAGKADGDHVETARGIVQAMADEEGLGEPADLGLLGRGDRFLRAAASRPGARFDFDEDQGAAAAGDDVDFSPQEPHAPGEDLISPTLEMAGGRLFAPPA